MNVSAVCVLIIDDLLRRLANKWTAMMDRCEQRLIAVVNDCRWLCAVVSIHIELECEEEMLFEGRLVFLQVFELNCIKRVQAFIFEHFPHFS